MKQLKAFLVIGVLILIAIVYISAQYTGPGSTGKMYKVNQINNDASRLDKSDALVKLQGYIIEQISNDTYWFEDGTGKIKVEIDKKNMPGKPFDEKTQIILYGEVDYDLLEGVEIEAEGIEFINK